jgi:AcrR family transcriptional regulator
MSRPTVPLVSRTLAVEAATRLIDAHGLEGLSMRAVGAALGVSGPALYHHFANKEALLDAVADALLAEALPTHPVDDDWAHCLLDAVCTYRDALLAHPHAIPLLTRLRRDSGSLGYYAELFARMRQDGLSDAQIDTLVSGHLALATGAALGRLRELAGGAEPWRALLCSDDDDDTRLRRACAALQAGIRAR